MSKGTPITPFELELANKVSTATFHVGTAAKRFIRNANEHTLLTDRGRWFLAFIAHRFRRQYTLSTEQWMWVGEHLKLPAAAKP